MVQEGPVSSLRNRIEHGRTVAHLATFLMRSEAEVRAKAAELGLALPAVLPSAEFNINSQLLA